MPANNVIITPGTVRVDKEITRKVYHMFVDGDYKGRFSTRYMAERQAEKVIAEKA
jgi:hypothetical protein